jgi:hypothetical protein
MLIGPVSNGFHDSMSVFLYLLPLSKKYFYEGQLSALIPWICSSYSGLFRRDVKFDSYCYFLIYRMYLS